MYEKINSESNDRVTRVPKSSRKPLTIEEYETNFRQHAGDLQLVERVFRGGLDGNQLRAALWPLIFGLVKERGRFFKSTSTDKFVYIDHEDNVSRWRELERQYRSYEAQWKSIHPEQELRFSMFRERRALIERDVVRSDRSHPFYKNSSNHLNALTNLLMTYMMYDFDIGYLQGMSDIAAPILYVYQGNPVKSFWVFVEVMKLFRRNFETSQKTIHFQLNCLYRLVKLKDAKLARHLRVNECSNCFFVFRSIVCQFKRELMKQTSDRRNSSEAVNENMSNENMGGLSDGLASRSSSSSCSTSSSLSTSEEEEDDDDDECGYSEHENDDCGEQVERNYNRVLNLWDTIWCVQRRHELLAKSKCVHTFTIANTRNKLRPEQIIYTKESCRSKWFDPNQADVPRFELTEPEKFVLALCLALIRRERHQILGNQMDASEIHQHFINPPGLADDFDAFLEQAYEVYEYLNTDCDLKLLVRGADELAGEAHTFDLSAPISGADDQLSSTADTYELLKDYLIISPTAYTPRNNFLSKY